MKRKKFKKIVTATLCTTVAASTAAGAYFVSSASKGSDEKKAY